MFCPECGTPIKKGSYICANCKFKIKLTTEIVDKKDKKEKNDDKTKKIEKKKAKTNRKKKEVEVKTSMNDIDGMKPEEPKEDLNIDLKTKEKIDRNIVTQNDINKPSIKINEDVPFEIEKVIEKPVIRIDPEAEKSISINSILPEGPNKKEKNDDKTKKIEKSKSPPVHKNEKVKRNFIKKIGSLYNELIDNSFREKT